MSFTLDALPERYRVILCDIWGVVHDGVHLTPGAADRLARWRGEGRNVVLLTNAPRTADAVKFQLDRLGLPRHCWDSICTSGEAGIAGLLALGEPVGFIGTPADRDNLESRGIIIADQGFDHVAVTGIDGIRMAASDYAADLAAYGARSVIMHCLNPDMLVIRGGVPEACAGAIAELYVALGGRVEYYGKPHDHIYEHAFALAGDPPRDNVVAIGDGLPTDVLGAARYGVDCIFIQGGIHAGDPFPAGFAPQYGLGDWAPVAQFPSIG